MKTVLLLFLSVTVVSSCCTQKKAGEAKEFTVSEIVTKIDREYASALEKLQDRDFEIKSVDVKLTVNESRTAGGGIKVFAKVGGSFEKTQSTSMSFSLEKPAVTKNNVGFEQGKKLDLKKLSDLIVAIADQFDSIDKIADLEKKSCELTIAFSVKNTGTAGVEFEFAGIGIDPSYERSRGSEHEITLTFGKKEKAEIQSLQTNDEDLQKKLIQLCNDIFKAIQLSKAKKS